MPRVVNGGRMIGVRKADRALVSRRVEVPAGVPNAEAGELPPEYRVSVRSILRRVVDRHERQIEAALIKGLRAKPPYSFAYLQLAAHYLDGKPVDHVEISGDSGPAFMVQAERLALACTPEQLAQLESVLLSLAAVPHPSVPLDPGSADPGARALDLTGEKLEDLEVPPTPTPDP
jgi:hypothetical protein